MDTIKEAYQRKDRIKNESRAEARKKIRFEASLDFVTRRSKIEQDFKDEKDRLDAEQVCDDEEYVARKRKREEEHTRIVSLRDDACVQLVRKEKEAAQTSIQKAEDAWAVRDKEDDQKFLAWLKGAPLTDLQTDDEVSLNDIDLNSTPTSTPVTEGDSMNQDSAVPEKSTGTSDISADSDDEPILGRRERLKKSSSEKVNLSPEPTLRTIKNSEIENEDFIVEMPKSSRNYYVMRCPHCPDKRFGAHGPYFHFNNKYKMHGYKLRIENVLEICGRKVKGVTPAWVEKHNSSFILVGTSKKFKIDPTQNTSSTSTLLGQSPKLSQENTVKNIESQVSGKRNSPLPTVRSSMFKLGPGDIYCSPTCLEGVPYEKVDESSPYWELDWNTWTDWMSDKEMKVLSETILRKRASKGSHNSLKDLEREYRRLSKDMEHRQEVQAYFNKYRWHPNQLLSKTYVHGTGILAGRTVEELYRILTNLERVPLDLEPFDWLRRRLSTLISECEKQGSSFSIKATLNAFNNDPHYTKIKARIESDIMQVNTEENGKRDVASEEALHSINHSSTVLKTTEELDLLKMNHSKMNGSLEQLLSQDEKTAGDSSDTGRRNSESSISNKEISNDSEDTSERIHPSDTSPTETRPTKIQKIGLVNAISNVDSPHVHHPPNVQETATEPIIPSDGGLTLIGGRQKEIQKSITDLGLSSDMNPALIGGRLLNIQKLSASLGLPSSMNSASVNDYASEIQKPSTTNNVSPDVNENGKRVQLVESYNSTTKIRKVHDDPSTPSFQPRMKRVESDKRISFSQLQPPRHSSAPVFSSSARPSTTTVKASQNVASSPKQPSPTVRNETQLAKYSTVICLTRLSCGSKVFPQGNKRSYKFHSEAGHWEPFLNDNPIMMFEENLVITRSDVINLAFHTEVVQGDTVILIKKAQNPQDPALRIACTFNSADVADQFANSLWRPRRPHEKALIMSRDDEIRILQYRQASRYAAKPTVQQESRPCFTTYESPASSTEQVSLD